MREDRDCDADNSRDYYLFGFLGMLVIAYFCCICINKWSEGDGGEGNHGAGDGGSSSSSSSSNICVDGDIVHPIDTQFSM